MKLPRVVSSHRLFRSPASLLVVLIWCITSLTTVAALQPSRTIKRDATPELIQEDQCTSFSTELGRELKSLLHLNWMEVGGNVDMCLCSSTLSTFIDNSKNKQIEIARAMVGKAKVQEALEILIARHSPKKCSTIPTHATRTCNSDGRRSDVCDFSCQSPYRNSGNKCVLAPSPSARPRKRSLEEEVVMAISSCLPHEQVCAGNGNVNGGRSSKNRNSIGFSNKFECIDVSRDLVNCGGCAAGSLGLSSEVTGVDCSELPGVSDVQCVVGRCRVSRCTWGWQVNSRGDGCVRMRR